MNALDDVRADLVDNLAALEREATKVYRELVVPSWGSEFHGFGRTLHAYMMSALAHVDLASTYLHGSNAKQTPRMEAFLTGPLGLEPEASRVMVKMWRHVLMHTAKPRRLLRPDGRHYYWLLHWSEHLPRRQHMTFIDSADSRILNIGFLYFLSGLRTACDEVITHLEQNPAAALRASAALVALREQRL
jgi:hypothetical protein